MSNRCERCNEKLIPGNETWLELSQTDGKYYLPGAIPKGHVSQGSFPFGIVCAVIEVEIKKQNKMKKEVKHGGARKGAGRKPMPKGEVLVPIKIWVKRKTVGKVGGPKRAVKILKEAYDLALKGS